MIDPTDDTEPKDAWTPLGLALQDYRDGRHDAAVALHLEDGRIDQLPIAALFRADGLTPADELAVAMARGRVLDAGAGAGAVSLALQEEGHPVVALDLDPHAVMVMTLRGVRDARVGDLRTFVPVEPAAFDTVLMLMNGIGLAGDLAGLDSVFDALHRLVAPGGVVLVDSADLTCTDDPHEHERMAARRNAGRYAGAVRYRMAYGDASPAPAFSWLFVDPATLAAYATDAGWTSQVIFEDDDGTYLARLSRADATNEMVANPPQPGVA